MPDLREQLQCILRGRVCMMGIGNVDHGDDGFGVYLAKSITMRLTGSGAAPLAHNVINAGTTPERLIGSITEKNYDHLIFLDAVEFGGAPGSVLLLNAEEIAARFPQISTHKLSIGLLARCIKTGAGTNVSLLGVQPWSLKRSPGLSPAVQRTMETLDQMLCDIWLSMKDAGDATSARDLIRA